MERPRERSDMGLKYVVMCPVVDGVVGVSTIVNLGRSGDATPRGLPRSTPMSGLVYDI